MKFEWDERKRKANLAKHGIDFVDAVTIWRGEVIDPESSSVDRGELRIVAIGRTEGNAKFVAIVYTNRKGVRRIISARAARRYERTYYQSKFGRSPPR